MSEIQNNNLELQNTNYEQKESTEYSDSEITNYENIKNEIKTAEKNDKDDFSVKDLLSQIDNVQEVQTIEEIKTEDKVAQVRTKAGIQGLKQAAENLKNFFKIG